MAGGDSVPRHQLPDWKCQRIEVHRFRNFGRATRRHERPDKRIGFDQCSVHTSSRNSTQKTPFASELQWGMRPKVGRRRKQTAQQRRGVQDSECPRSRKSLRSPSAHVNEQAPIPQEHRRASGSSSCCRLQKRRSPLHDFSHSTGHVGMAFSRRLGPTLGRGGRPSHQGRVASCFP